MEQSKGTLHLESTPGKGTVVTLRFARLPRPETDAPSPRRQTADDRETHKTLLLVEDEPAVLKVTTRMLEHLGYRVCPAHDADTAWQMLREGLTPDLVVSDIDMPGHLNGIDLAQLLRTEQPDLPVLLVSGYPLQAAQEATKDDPLRRTLQKPVSVSSLSRAVTALMQRDKPKAMAGE